MDQTDALISVGAAAATESWGFVGVVTVGDAEAYRTLEAWPAPADALRHTQQLLGAVLGELLAAAEWRGVRNDHGRPPTRQDYNFSALRASPHPA